MFEFKDFVTKGVIHQTFKGHFVETRFVDRRRGIRFAPGDHVGLITNWGGRPYVLGIGIVVNPIGKTQYDVFLVKASIQAEREWELQRTIVKHDSWQVVWFNGSYAKYKGFFESEGIDDAYEKALEEQKLEARATALKWKYLHKGAEAGYLNLATGRRLKRKRKGLVFTEKPAKLAYPAEMDELARRVRRKLEDHERVRVWGMERLQQCI